MLNLEARRLEMTTIIITLSIIVTALITLWVLERTGNKPIAKTA